MRPYTIALLILFLLIVDLSSAFAGYDISSGNTGVFSSLSDWLQDAVDFVQDTLGVAGIVVGTVAAVLIFVVAPRFGQGLGMAVRAVLGGIVLFNLTVLMTSIGG